MATRSKKTFNVIGQLVCTTRDGWTSSDGLPSIEVRATSKTGAVRAAKKIWRARGKLPKRATKSCRLYPSAEEV